MSEKYAIIWDFCDWLNYQGVDYDRLYDGITDDIDTLIEKYVDDEEWATW